MQKLTTAIDVYVDGSDTTGKADDNNSGSAVAPLLTYGELKERLRSQILRQPIMTLSNSVAGVSGVTMASMNVHLLSDLAPNDPIGLHDVTFADAGSILHFGSTVVSRNGVISSAADANPQAPNGGSFGVLSDSSVTSWVPDIGKQVMVTSGPFLGAKAYILDDLTNGFAAVSPFAFSFAVALFPQVIPSASLAGASYAVIRQVKANLGSDWLLSVEGNNSVSSIPFRLFINHNVLSFSDIAFQATPGNATQLAINAPIETRFSNCTFECAPLFSGMTNVNIYNCVTHNGMSFRYCDVPTVLAGADLRMPQADPAVLPNSQMIGTGRSLTFLYSRCIVGLGHIAYGGPSITAGVGSYMGIGNVQVFGAKEETIQPVLPSFQGSGITGVDCHIELGNYFGPSTLSGNGNQRYGMNLTERCELLCTNEGSFPINITGALGDGHFGWKDAQSNYYSNASNDGTGPFALPKGPFPFSWNNLNDATKFNLSLWEPTSQISVQGNIQD